MMSIADELFSTARSWSERPSNDGPGDYAYLLDRATDLTPVTVDDSGLIYVGMSEDSLDTRCHFNHAHSGFSTLRRSLGAILKNELTLRAIPRAPGSSRSNSISFRFDEDGETRLTAWMRMNFKYSHYPLAVDMIATERNVIRTLQPPLNLIGWPNPQRGLIKKLRAACASEARVHQGH